MSPKLAPGDVVRHAVHGTGRVTALRHRGFECRVRFAGIERWVRVTSLRSPSWASATATDGGPDADAAAAPGAAPAPPRRAARARPRPPRIGADELARLRAALEAFRMGIVPDQSLAQWTVGRDAALARVHSWLANQGHGTLLVESPYGGGKTHLLRHLAQTGIAEGYATSMVHIDPSRASSAFPRRLYHELATALRYRTDDGVGDLRDLLEEAASHGGAVAELAGHRHLGPLLERTAARGRLGADDWAAVSGRPMRAGRGYVHLDYTTMANVVCYLLSGLGHLVGAGLGRSGLLLLVDELETAQVVRFHYHWVRSLDLLRGLATMADDDPDALDERVAHTRDGYRGERTGLIYSGHLRDVPYVYRVPSFVKVVIALTPGNYRAALRRFRDSRPVLELAPLPRRELHRLFRRVAAAYVQIHDIQLSPEETDTLFAKLWERFPEGSVRFYLKAAVELMDYMRHRHRRGRQAAELLDAG